jgi:hypothetical protein
LSSLFARTALYEIISRESLFISYLVTQQNNSISNLSFQSNVNKSVFVAFHKDIQSEILQNMRENILMSLIIVIMMIIIILLMINVILLIILMIMKVKEIQSICYAICYIHRNLNSTQLSALLHLISAQINRYVPHLSVSLS